ncbi:hypothetical protein AAFF_G00273360 [Aldrovandia affinis]|uniref:Uncharacterized protein n=1 Tax=Aldrovandia affinis TaxID=143900 RepID=A0AAD7SRG4_9TELE|nr:hypothetical protein AAFF_G00273360 [Aldrovandia affinis]
MQHITMVMCLIGMCSSFPILNEHGRTERSVSNENTNQGNAGQTQASTGLTGAGFVGIGGFYQNPSQSSYQPVTSYAQTTQVNPGFNPYTVPTQVNPGFNPYTVPTQVNPGFNPYTVPTQVNPGFNPYTVPTQVNPGFNPYTVPTQVNPGFNPYTVPTQSSNGLLNILPFLLARLIPTPAPAAGLTAPVTDGN